jgi:short-subunit dehydrogenase
MDTTKGKTALITGASSGIGRAIAHRLAREGARLVLVARSEENLGALAAELETLHGTRSTVLAADLGQPHSGAGLFKRVEEQDLAIDILVNNAGFGTYGTFESIKPETEQAEIAVNIAAVVDLTHSFVPGMLQRGSGAIINIASTSSFQPTPFHAVYGATKAFILNFSEALWAEYRGRGVLVTALCPGAVDTAFIEKLGDTSVRNTSVYSSPVRPETVAERVIEALRSGSPSHIIGLKNWLMALLLRFTPRSVVALVGASLLRPRAP